MSLKNKKIIEVINSMFISYDNVSDRSRMPFYAEFLTYVNFKESKRIKTCAVSVTSKGMNFFYNEEFVNNLKHEELKYVVVHEIYHLLFDHISRTKENGFEPKLSNIAQDAIINNIINSEIPQEVCTIPKRKIESTGALQNIGVHLPKNYTGKHTYEDIYVWLKEERQKINDNCDFEKVPYGENGKIEHNINETRSPLECTHYKNFLISDFLDDLFDEHLDSTDEIPEQAKKNIVNNIMSKMRNTGKVPACIESDINKLNKNSKDYLQEFKKNFNELKGGSTKEKTFRKVNRKQIHGLKGKIKNSSMLNVVLDVSGSMSGSFEEVLSYVFKKKTHLNLIQIDTEVTSVDNKINSDSLESIKLSGFGGTDMQEAFDLIAKDYNNYNTVLLTDGYFDAIDMAKIKGKLLVLTTGAEVEVLNNKRKVKQILVTKES